MDELIAFLTENYPELAERLATTAGDMTDEELGAIEGDLLSLFDDLRERIGEEEGVTLTLLSELRDAVALVRSEAEVRYEAAEEVERAVAELAEELRPEAEQTEPGDPEAGGDPEEPADPEPAPEPEAEPAQAEQEPVPVAAAARQRTSLAQIAARRPAQAAPRLPAQARRSRARIVGPTGAELHTMQDIVAAMIERVESLSGPHTGATERFRVARVIRDFPADQRIDTTQDMERLVASVQDAVMAGGDTFDALVAAGGVCAPPEPIYDVPTIATASRPVRDSLPRRGASRGAILVPPTFGLADMAGAVSQWTQANDVDARTAGGSDPTKPCIEIDCASSTEVELYAVVTCLKFGNWDVRTWPERQRAIIDTTLAQHAREAEGMLLSAIATGSTAVTAAKKVSAVRDLLYQIDVAGAAYRNVHRMDPSAPLRVILPAWVQDMLRSDLTRQLATNGDAGLGTTDAQIAAWFAVRNVNVTWHLDQETGGSQVFATQGAAAMNNWPATIVWYLFHEGAWAYLDGGTLDIGMVRDATLNSVNAFQTFTEEFEAVARVGFQSLKVTSTTDASGASSGSITPPVYAATLV